jgi:poly-gamma-glutamate synthesis protein (capsule biosynthesis protein)
MNRPAPRRAAARGWFAGLVLAGGLAHAGPSASLVFAGDIMLDGALGRLVAAGRDPFAAVAPLLRADIRVGNLECTVATVGNPAADKRYTFRANPRVLPVLRRHFDAVSVANNHSGDFGRDTFLQTLDHLDATGIGRFGGGRSLREAHRPLLIERGGLRIALLGYNEFMPRMFEAEADAPGVAWSEDEQVAEDIADARRVWGADLVIPVMHWGWENELRSGPRQRRLARRMVEAGADAVIGGHPHVVQEVEPYRGVPIVYSVGNFAMELSDNDAQRLGWVLRLELDERGVAALRTDAVRLDRRGLPRPAADRASPCWRRGDAGVSDCPLPGGRRRGSSVPRDF